MNPELLSSRLTSYRAVDSVSEGYDGTAGGVKAKAGRSVLANRSIWTVTEMRAGRDDLLCEF